MAPESEVTGEPKLAEVVLEVEDEVMVAPVEVSKEAVVAAVLALAAKLVLRISRVDVDSLTTVDVPVTMVCSLVTTVDVLSRQPTLPLRRVGIASG